MKDTHEDIEVKIDGKDILVTFETIHAKWQFRSGRIAKTSVECNILIKDFWRGSCKLHGKSFCSEKDTFDKVTGYKIALTRALAQVPLTKDFRTKVWQAFFEWVRTSAQFTERNIDIVAEIRKLESQLQEQKTLYYVSRLADLRIGDYFKFDPTSPLCRKIGDDKVAVVGNGGEILSLCKSQWVLHK